ncbi:hypothetical protein F5878DRAFT_689607 [Lentinula raphanica]|uniref:protein-serine/threonine phosphatase n=1 Tax=Lentinula raphanica TaxID=153919 RepID=A0AA38UKQ0_9AGAR|nr:hypothetical protein F5878DRAFT_689607 [Lentinula raphanica]
MPYKDLANLEDLKEYLEGTPFASSEIDILTGGTGNFACRLRLLSPYEAQSTLVLKHAKPYVFTSENKFPFSLERQRFEVEALKIVRASIPGTSFVTVPKVYLFDEKESIIIMEDCGSQSTTLKQFVLDGKCTLDVAETIGSELGSFMDRVHSTINRKNTAETCDAFEVNAEGKRISAWATYGRLVSTLKGEDELPALDPPLIVEEEDMSIVSETAERVSTAILEARDTFVMGDFWPGNILLSLDSQTGAVNRISIVDWELSKTGEPGLDLGQFTAEVDLLRKFNPSFKVAGTKMLSAFHSSYSAKEDIARMAVVHWGAHLIAWTPRVPWGSKEDTREMVAKGIKLIVAEEMRRMWNVIVVYCPTKPEPERSRSPTHILGFNMEPSPTKVYLPPSFPYPIKISSIDTVASTEISRGTRLLSYSFVYLGQSQGSQPETRFGTWDSAIDGTLQSWNINVGDVISQKKAKEKPVAVVIEPCKHGMQLHGLCVLCGKDMTNIDYIGFSDTSRASIQMTHSASGPTVSLEEAQRIERETAQRLLKDRKLSLIVDLDQTIVHATVDPTVGEWIAEGEAWEARRAAKGSGKDDDDPDDQCNPNWEALKDVKKFRLGPETLGSSPRARGKAYANKGVENEGCIYYIKPRPCWQQFLREMAELFEMHVYTMGTRAYAEEVCAAIDPDGKAFGGRILSRDESGSLTQKSLQRLFPCDTSMVVIIDDRADVWEWSPNLLKVIPFDFFVGIGDINSTFLPKIEPLTVSTPPSTHPTEASSSSPASTDIAESSPTPEELERSEEEKKTMLSKNSETLNAQVQERPLAKMQEELKHSTVAVENSPSQTEVASPEKPEQQEQQPENSKDEAKEQGDTEIKLEEKRDQPRVESKEPPKPEKQPPRKALLENNDHELIRVNEILSEIHYKFYNAYDARTKQSQDPQRRKSNASKSNKPSYDVTKIIPQMRADVLKGVHLLFSSVIPLDTRPETTEIWRMAIMFGAHCTTELTPETTHVVAAKRGTVKVDAARRRGNIKVVWLAWFTDSIALWQRQDETRYLLDAPPAVGPSASPPTASSDLDIDIDDEDWDLDSPPTSGGVALGVNQSSGFHADEINWNDINDEVEAAMMESDDEEEEEVKSTRSDRSGIRSGNASEEEMSDESNSVASANNTPQSKRKRLRSLTPSEVPGLNGDSDGLRSPLSKRKKVAADRSGMSKLKVAIHADDLHHPGSRDPSLTPSKITGSRSNSPMNDSDMEEITASGLADKDEDESDDESEADDAEDDFLARELENEWG